MPFPLSDATALILRLEMEQSPSAKIGLDFKDTWRELGEAYSDLANSINNVFYDFHALVALLFSDKKEDFQKLKSNIEEQVCTEVKYYPK